MAPEQNNKSPEATKDEARIDENGEAEVGAEIVVQPITLNVGFTQEQIDEWIANYKDEWLWQNHAAEMLKDKKFNDKKPWEAKPSECARLYEPTPYPKENIAGIVIMERYGLLTHLLHRDDLEITVILRGRTTYEE